VQISAVTPSVFSQEVPRTQKWNVVKLYDPRNSKNNGNINSIRRQEKEREREKEREKEFRTLVPGFPSSQHFSQHHTTTALKHRKTETTGPPEADSSHAPRSVSSSQCQRRSRQPCHHVSNRESQTGCTSRGVVATSWVIKVGVANCSFPGSHAWVCLILQTSIELHTFDYISFRLILCTRISQQDWLDNSSVVCNHPNCLTKPGQSRVSSMSSADSKWAQWTHANPYFQSAATQAVPTVLLCSRWLGYDAIAELM
jgi:hypothetical protein